MAIEDERFYQHTGVDFEGFMRALVTNIQAKGMSEGFSTITMQLVGNLYLDRTDISFTRKFNEMALAWQMEKKYSKDEILDMYLNTVYFGSNAYGVEAAARTYFDKDPVDLTLAEAALLAGLPQAPSAYSPRKHPEDALKRRNLILLKMYELGFHHRGAKLREALRRASRAGSLLAVHQGAGALRRGLRTQAAHRHVRRGQGLRGRVAGGDDHQPRLPEAGAWKPSPPPSIEKTTPPRRW